MFFIYSLLLFIIIPLPLAQQYLLTSAGEEEKDKISAKWLGIELDGAYFFDWTTGRGEHVSQMVAAEALEPNKESEEATEDVPRHFVIDNCITVKTESQRGKEDFMHLVQPKCWDDLQPVAWECSAHSGAECLNMPLKTCYHLWVHAAAFLIVAQLLYVF